MGDGRRAGESAGPRAEWVIPGADVSAGAAEVVRLVHASLPQFAWGRKDGRAWVVGPAPAPRRLPEDLTDAEHAGYVVRLAGLLSFLAAHGLGLAADGAATVGSRPGARDVPWLASPPVPAWRAVPAPLALGLAALRLEGRRADREAQGDPRSTLEAAIGDDLSGRGAEIVSAALRAHAGGRPFDALLLDMARAGGVGEKVALDLLGLAVPRELEACPDGILIAAGESADWVARGMARRAPGETSFAEAGPSSSLEDGALLSELADALGPDPRAATLRSLSRGETPHPESGPPLALLAREADRWDGRSRAVWEELPRFLEPLVRIETRAEVPPPWTSGSLLVPRLGRDEISGLVHLPCTAPAAFSRLWEALAAEAAGDAGRFLRAARRKARRFLDGATRPSSRRRPDASGDAVLRVSSLLGDGFTVEEASAAAGLPAARVADVLEEACEAGALVRAGRDAYRFGEASQRKRLASGLSAAERASAVSRLESAGTGPIRLLLARLAAGEREHDLEEARRRLRAAIEAGRAADATVLLDRAPVSDPDLGEPLLALEAWVSAGRMEEARLTAGRIDAAGSLGHAIGQRERTARLLVRLGADEKALALLPESADVEGRVARADVLLRLRREEAAARLLRGLPTAGGSCEARIHLLRADLHERRQELEAAEAELRAAALAFEEGGEPGPDDARFMAGYLALGLKRPREAQAFFRAARDGASDPSRRADALFDLSVAAAAAGDLADAERSLEEALGLLSSLGERDRYLSALGQRVELALRRSDARGARRDLAAVLAHDRLPGRSFQLLFSVPLRQRLALADGDDADGAEAFAEAVPALRGHPGHPARRELLVLEGARLLAAGSPAEALARLEEAEEHPDARSGVEPLRERLALSAALDLGRHSPIPPGSGAAERALADAEERLSRGLAPDAGARRVLVEMLAKPEGPLLVATRLLEWRGRFPAFFTGDEAAPLRETGLRAARFAGLDGALARLAPPRAGGAPPVDTGPPAAAAPVAEDPATREVFDTVRRVARARISVLVLGESGTGKEVVARELHRLSGRGGPFVAVNVSSLPDTLAEAELFGAARGAFTGSDRDRAGVIEASSGGTLLLDEIGDLSAQVQAKLLRVLQEREVRRLGETRTRKLDLRLVAATHRDLERLVEAGSFRGDLLYRIAGITVCLPPLRERPRDLRLLLERALGGTPIAPDARAVLLSWGWPGNVRELLSAVEAAKAMASGGRVEKAHLPPRLRAEAPAASPANGRYRRAVDEAKRRVILETLSETGGNRTRAAALLGLSRQSLLYEMKRLSITD